jgi:hypothetical protein
VKAVAAKIFTAAARVFLVLGLYFVAAATVKKVHGDGG